MSEAHLDWLTRWTNLALATAACSAVVGILVRGNVGAALDAIALVLLGTLPALRVMVLAARWGHDGDRRYAIAAVGLLLMMTFGVVVVARWR